jgi:hypothetical protein
MSIYEILPAHDPTQSVHAKISAIYQIIIHLNKITECLKMTTFKIVFIFDVSFSAETTMHCKVTCILYK